MRMPTKIELRPIASLKKAKRNPRTHTKKQINQLGRSMQRFGWTSPVLIDEQGNIIAGHGRVDAGIELGLQEAPCIVLAGLTPDEMRAYLLLDNQLGLNSDYDLEVLAAEILDLNELGFEMELMGFDNMDSILTQAEKESTKPEPSGEDDPPPAPWAPVSRAGDIFVCGNHRVACGNIKDTDFVARVMAGAKAIMAFTDPPYNQRINGHVMGKGRTKHPEFAEASGEMSPVQFQDFLQHSLEVIESHCDNGAIVYTCMDWRGLQAILAAGFAVFTELKNLCVWAKTNAGMGSFYRSQYECVLVWKVGDAPHINTFGLGDKGRHRTNLWTYPGVNAFGPERMNELEFHPTVKPVALVADAIRDVSRRGDTVLDFFGGSGTTLIAAQKTGRKARLLEIDPRYCDVAVLRWQKMTGKQAILEATGQTFEDVALERFGDPSSMGEAA